MDRLIEFVKTLLLGAIAALLLLTVLGQHDEASPAEKNPNAQRYSATTLIDDKAVAIVDQQEGIVKLYAFSGDTLPIVTYRFNQSDSTVSNP